MPYNAEFYKVLSAFSSLAAAVDLEGEGVVAAAAEQFDLLGHDLNVAGGLVGVFARALAHGALHSDCLLYTSICV